MKNDFFLKTIKNRWGPKSLLAAGTLLLGSTFLLHRRKKHLQSNPHPVGNYNEAIRRIRRTQEKEKSFVSDQGRTILLTHNKKTKWSVILLHGYTNCPAQFRELGQLFFERGCNVFIPRMPYHGLYDLLTKKHSRLTAKALTTFADSTVDTARELGDSTDVIGISAGGTIAGWIALSRKDIRHCVLISPVFGYYGFPQYLMRPLMYMLLILPNFFRWWDAKIKVYTWEQRHVYPRYATKAVGELLRLGFGVHYLLRRGTECKASITIITNRNDQVVNNKAIFRILRLWKKKYPAAVSSYEFSEEYGLDHDIIDPEHENQNTELVYPVILNLIAIPS